MNDHSSVDRETFQQLLASAYAVQESQINRQSLSAILDIQRSIASGKLDLDGAMHFIVESARDVANASGVAIGLLKGDRLTYRAGSGTSAAFVGQHVTASLTVSAFTRTNREILRVEDAENDTRIEADICRQFGANSLLMLPIYFDHVVAGILDIRFNQAHTFQDREVRAYRLMAEQIEGALSHSVQHQPHEVAPDLTAAAAIPEGVLLEREKQEDLEDAPRFWMGESSVPSFFERCQSSLASAKGSPAFQRSVASANALARRAVDFFVDQRERYFVHNQKAKRFFDSNRIRYYINHQFVSLATAKESPVFQRSLALANALARRSKHFFANHREKYFVHKQQTRRFLSSNRIRYYINHQRVKYITRMQRAQYLAGHLNLRPLVLVSVAVLVVFTGFLTYRYQSPAPSLQSATLPKSTAPDQPEVSKPLPGKTVAEPELIPAKVGTGRVAHRRLRLAESEIQYFGDDVTVRTFSPKPAAQRSLAPKNRVTHFGNDVTVRYFTSPQPIVRPVSR